MAVNIPTLKELRDSIVNDLNGKLGIAVKVFGKNFLYTLVGVLAAKLKVFYLTLADVQKNIAPDLADSELIGGTLERWGRLILGRDPFPAIGSVYSVTVTGQIGATIKGGTTFKSNDDSSNPGFLYILDADYILTATSEEIEVRSLETGTQTQLIIGDELTATSPILNVESIVSVFSEVQEPLDAETEDDYRDKVKQQFQLDPQGGASADFRLWSYDAIGVRQSYPYAKSGESANINLFVEATASNSTDGKGTPSQAILDEVLEVIELDPDINKPLFERGRRPLGAHTIYSLPITPSDVIVSITGLSIDTPEIRQTVEDSLKNYLDGVRPFVSGADIYDERNDILNINKLSFVIVSALPDNAFFNSVSFTVNGINTIQYQFLNGNIPYFDSVVFN